MSPAVVRPVPDEQSLERQIEKQMGCMAGFLQLFDRHQILSTKRLYSPKRLASFPPAGSTSPSECSEASSMPLPEQCPSSPESHVAPPEIPSRPSQPLPLPLFDFKDGMRSSWKLREAPRLSLDSRAILDAKGKLRPWDILTTLSPKPSDEHAATEDQRRSPSVVARLMGLDALPSSGEQPSKAELRRSSSESRVPRDLGVFQPNSPPDPAILKERTHRSRTPDIGEFRKPDLTPRNPMQSLQRKSYFDARDYFPEPKTTGTLYGEIERRLRMRGIDEPARDLETLKQILEALQLKGLLHSRPSDHNINGRRNLVYDQYIPRGKAESPIVVMKPFPRSPAVRRSRSESAPLPPRSGPVRRGLMSDPVAPPRTRWDRVKIERSPRSPDPRSPSLPARRRASSAESQRTVRPQRKSPPVPSPRSSPKRVLQSPRNGRTIERPCSPAEDDTSTHSSISSYSQFDFERVRMEEYKVGRSLLQRCDKLLHSIAAITSSSELATALDPQPSPVSVLDSASFLGDENSPPPVYRRSLDFSDNVPDWGDDHWNQTLSTVRLEFGGGTEVDGKDFSYVSEIIRASDRHQVADIYSMLEKRRPGSKDECDESRLYRRLVFDTVAEIVGRTRPVSAWDAFSRPKASIDRGAPLLRHVWLELVRLRDVAPSDDLNDATCVVIEKDMARDHLWGDASVEISDAVLHIERMLFKDLVADTIRDLADLAVRSRAPRRKLVF